LFPRELRQNNYLD